ncbi:DUF4166 domain-containing protein [Caldimonas brevitalea]|uniref:DUF4166 domain-containing protein n=1 Tax=Caldimonas brevitalea TaxID=413882 RepID=A0A0G3BU87_9BURK|nr:DUF4166 domain-containing protein [Caldimonas brevitalea]AKJ30095.1 hypothetical protein AAW51_3404 [Caldimonas brevitalea]
MNTVLHPAAADRAPELNFAEMVGAAQWQQLSLPIRRRFAAGHGDVSYRGSMALRASPLGRCFALLARLLGSPLAAGRQHEVPTTVNVRHDGRGGVVWERLLGRPDAAGAQCVRSTKRMGPDSTLEECTDGGLSMSLAVRVEDGALVFYSRCYFVLLLGRWRLPVPALLTPGTCRVEHRDEGPGRFRFTLDMVHPLWGHTFHQTGVFADPEAC